MTEQSWDDGVIWGPPCQCGGQFPPHRHGASTDVNTTWVATVSVVNTDSPDNLLQALIDVWGDKHYHLEVTEVRCEFPRLAIRMDALTEATSDGL